MPKGRRSPLDQFEFFIGVDDTGLLHAQDFFDRESAAWRQTFGGFDNMDRHGADYVQCENAGLKPFGVNAYLTNNVVVLVLYDADVGFPAQKGQPAHH